MSKSMILKPRMSEKAYAQSENENTYVFDIPANATSLDVAKAVSSRYDVTVTRARIATTAAKSRRRYTNRTWRKGEKPAIKKAYVTLKEGDNLPLFASAEEAEKKSDKKSKAKENK